MGEEIVCPLDPYGEVLEFEVKSPVSKVKVRHL